MKTWKVIVWNTMAVSILFLGLIGRDCILLGAGSAMFAVYVVSFCLNEKAKGT